METSLSNPFLVTLNAPYETPDEMPIKEMMIIQKLLQQKAGIIVSFSMLKQWEIKRTTDDWEFIRIRHKNGWKDRVEMIIQMLERGTPSLVKEWWNSERSIYAF